MQLWNVFNYIQKTNSPNFELRIAVRKELHAAAACDRQYEAAQAQVHHLFLVLFLLSLTPLRPVFSSMSLPSAEVNSPPTDDGSLQESSSQSRLAPYPFDKPCADIVLRTCDRVDFRVRRHILIEASPVFDSMFLFPQPQADAESPHAPVVDLAEDSGTIETLLRICYPIKNPPLGQPLDAIETMLRAAMKYEMESPVFVLTDHLLTLAERMPLAVWAVACRLHVEDVAKLAAQQLRNVPSLDFNSLSGMNGICAGDYFRLREFHRTPRSSDDMQLPFLSPPEASRNTETDDSLHVWPPVPFPDDQPPTVICRSSDGMEFGVHKDVLCAISSRFLDDFGAAEFARDVADAISGHDAPANAQEMKLPTVHVNARAAVLGLFLRLCYPRMETSSLYDLHVVADLLCLAEMYHTDAVARDVERLWGPEAKADPLSAYCVAVTRGLRERARNAAKDSLDRSLDGVYIPELEDTPALAYHRLLTYHASCRAAATNLLERRFPRDPSRPASEAPAAGPAVHTRPSTSSQGSGAGQCCGFRHVHFQPYNVEDNVARIFDETIASGFWCPTCKNRSRDIAKICNSLRDVAPQVSNITLEI
ncbi:hypothetical protein VTO73DRAFT_2519 [Trametes versicolor]